MIMNDRAQNYSQFERVGNGLRKRCNNPDRTHQIGLPSLRHMVWLVVLAACVTTLRSLAGQPELPAIACHPLMLDQECRDYLADMASATTPHARDAIQVRYELLLQEREQSCPCNLGHGWSRIRQPLPGSQS